MMSDETKMKLEAGPYLLPDGSGFAVMSMALPEDHWLYAEGDNDPPMPFRRGTSDPHREEWAKSIWAAAKYAVRCATRNGKDADFDPDALCQNMVVGLIGYWTPDGKDWCRTEEEKP